MSSTRSKRQEIARQAREEGWCQRSIVQGGPRKEYNALYDPNMRHYFEHPSIQKHLLRTGQVDGNGRVINQERARSKLSIIEKEFQSAERAEWLRVREEREVRGRVQAKRHEALELSRRDEQAQRVKEDRAIREALIHANTTLFRASVTSTGGKGKGKGQQRTRRRSRHTRQQQQGGEGEEGREGGEDEEEAGSWRALGDHLSLGSADGGAGAVANGFSPSPTPVSQRG